MKQYQKDYVSIIYDEKRTPKTDIRKAETPIEAIAAYCKFF